MSKHEHPFAQERLAGASAPLPASQPQRDSLEAIIEDHEAWWQKLSALLKNGGMTDPAFIVGQVQALVRGEPAASSPASTDEIEASVRALRDNGGTQIRSGLAASIALTLRSMNATREALIRRAEKAEAIAAASSPAPTVRVFNFSELWEADLRDGEIYRRQRVSSPFEHDQAHAVMVWYDDLVDLKQRAEKAEANLKLAAASSPAPQVEQLIEKWRNSQADCMEGAYECSSAGTNEPLLSLAAASKADAYGKCADELDAALRRPASSPQ